MSKYLVLSEKYVRLWKIVYSICLVILIVGAFILFLVPYFKWLPPDIRHTGQYIGIVAILGVLCGLRLDSLNEHAAIYRAITKNTEDKKD